jgi:hypothetical protein
VSKGWTIETATENAARWGDKTVCVQLFDVAIEDRSAAENAVRQHAGEVAIVQMSRERARIPGLSAGRVRARPSTLVPRSRLARP